MIIHWNKFRCLNKYSLQGAYFARDKVNRPGFSKLFIEAANEEREHAIKVIEYLLMRGELTQNVGELLSFPLHPLDQVWENGAKALSDALKLETHVTRKIRDIITTCEVTDAKNDYHVSVVMPIVTVSLVFIDEPQITLTYPNMTLAEKWASL